jgi:hypothetical protein
MGFGNSNHANRERSRQDQVGGPLDQSKQETMDLHLKTSCQVVKDYTELFLNRRAYTLQSMRPHPESGRHYYFRPKEDGASWPAALTQGIIREHLEGTLTIGLYAINPTTQRCKWVAIDADYQNSREDLLKLQYHLGEDHVQAALEMSKRGGHLWIFLASPLLARECRIYIYNLALRLGVPVKETGLRDGIEVFPKHDRLSAGGFGNAIRGPLGIHREANRRFWFYGADYTLEAQMAYLNRLRRVTEGELRRFIAGKVMPPGLAPAPLPCGPWWEYRRGKCGPEFNIVQYVGKVRRVGRNYVARCPSCASAGHDRGGDNLAILISDTRFYKCWAGCTKQMIRSALGHPIRARQSA